MQATFIVKNLTEAYVDQVKRMEAIPAFRMLDAESRGDLAHCIKGKIGNGSFRDRVDLNSILKKDVVQAWFSISPRRGYMLFTFTIQ